MSAASHAEAVSLGIPAYRDIAAITVTAPGDPVSLQDAVTGLDPRNTALLISAIRHAAGNRPEHRGTDDYLQFRAW